MYHPRLAGTHYEMGYYYASLIYKQGFRIERLPKLSPKALRFGRQSEEAVSEYYPEILEEMKGFADGCKSEYEYVASFLLNIGIEEFQVPKCSAFAARNNTEVIFGRNHDYSPAFKELTESCLVAPAGSYRFIGQSDVFIGKCDGVNEKGLAIGAMFVAGKRAKPGMNFEVANRFVLEKCATVREGLNALSGIALSTSQNFLLADKEGGMAVVEACAEKVRIREPAQEENFVVVTNNFLHPEMREMEKEHERNWFHSETRYKTIYNALIRHNRETNLSIAQKILSGHYGFVCQYDKRTNIDTLWSFIASLNKPSIIRAEGNPGKTTYGKDDRLSKEIERKNL